MERRYVLFKMNIKEKLAQVEVMKVLIVIGIFLMSITIVWGLTSQTETENFKVTFEFSKNSIIDKCLDIDIQNLNNEPADVNLFAILNETNINTEEFNVTMYEWVALDTEFPTYDSENVINYYAYPNETNSTFSLQDNCENFNLTHYFCNDTRTFQNGTEEKLKCQWEEAKMGALKNTDKFEYDYGEIKIPKYSLEPEDTETDDFGTIETTNGTKKFRICFKTPILNNDGGFGSKGTFYLDLNGEIFWDKTNSSWWNESWDYKREIGNLTSNFSYMNITYDSDMQADFDDLRFTNVANDTELNFTISDKSDGNWVTVRVHNIDSSIYMYYGNADVTTTSSASDTYFNPVSAYYLDDNLATTNVIDSLYNNAGTASEITSGLSSTGKISTSFSFDGTEKYVDCGNNTNLAGASMSISAWVYKTEDTAANRYIISKFGSSGAGSWLLRILADETVNFLWNVGGTTNEGITSTGTIPLNTWTYVVATYENGAQKIYIDGSEDGSGTSTSTKITTEDITYIARRTGITDYFNGSIDEGIIHNKALTADQVYQLYTQNEPVYTLGDEESQALPDCRFNGTVKDGDGNVINGARIVIATAETDVAYGNTSSDASGLWNLNVSVDGNYTVYAYEDGNLTRPGDIKPYVECIRV